MPAKQYPFTDPDSPIDVWFTDTSMFVKLCDGRIISTPLEWYPRLAEATPEQRQHFELMSDGIHWPDVDEDLSVNGVLKGWKPRIPVKDERKQ